MLFQDGQQVNADMLNSLATRAELGEMGRIRKITDNVTSLTDTAQDANQWVVGDVLQIDGIARTIMGTSRAARGLWRITAINRGQQQSLSARQVGVLPDTIRTGWLWLPNDLMVCWSSSYDSVRNWTFPNGGFDVTPAVFRTNRTTSTQNNFQHASIAIQDCTRTGVRAQRAGSHSSAIILLAIGVKRGQ